MSRKDHGNGATRSDDRAQDAGEAEKIETTVRVTQPGADDAAEPLDESLEAELDRARAEVADHYDRLLRTQAELQNVLKRHEKERLDRSRYAGEALARDLLSVVDDLERALQHAGEESRALAAGVELVHKSLLGVLSRHGVERIEAKGKPFDPSEHEAVAVVPTVDVDDNTVIEEHRAGYRMGDRLLRPAMVAVARAPQAGGSS
jgi:molecular chaperone GrpE